MVLLSHLINVFILIPVCLGLIRSPKSMNAVFGEDTTARQILTSIYLTIIIISSFCLIITSMSVTIGLILFPVQIIYKTLSLFLIKDRKVSVYKFNLFVACFHTITMIVLYNQGYFPF